MFFLTAWIFAFLFTNFYFPKNKKVFMISVLGMAILFAFGYDNADYLNYSREYSDSIIMHWDDPEPIWILIMHICNILGMSFSLFKGLIFLVSMLLIFKTVESITDDINIVLTLYFLYPFIIDATQIRNFFAMSILCYSLRYLASSSKIDVIKYITSIFIAFGVHNIFIIYLVLIFTKIIDLKKAIIVTFAVFVGLIAMFKMLPTLVLHFFENYHNGMAHTTKYVVKDTVSIVMILALVIFYVATVVGIIWANKQIQEMFELNVCSIDKLNYIQNLSKCILLMSLSFLLNVYSMDFARVLRNILVIEYSIIVFAVNNDARHSHIREKLIILSVVCYGCWVFIYYPYSDTVFFPLFTHNYVYEYLSFG